MRTARHLIDAKKRFHCWVKTKSTNLHGFVKLHTQRASRKTKRFIKIIFLASQLVARCLQVRVRRSLRESSFIDFFAGVQVPGRLPFSQRSHAIFFLLRCCAHHDDGDSLG